MIGRITYGVENAAECLLAGDLVGVARAIGCARADETAFRELTGEQTAREFLAELDARSRAGAEVAR
jgi:hypothetical protein